MCGFPFPELKLINSLKKVSCGNIGALLIYCLSGIIIFCCLMSSTLKTTASHTYFFLFYRFRRQFTQERVHSVGLSCSNPAHSPKRRIFRSGPSPILRTELTMLSGKSVVPANSLGPHCTSLSRYFKLTV